MNLHRLTEADFAESDCPTTKRYARTLAEAFEDERAPVIERPVPSGYSLSWWLAMAIVASLAAIVITLGRPA